MNIYRIVSWNDNFENNRTRELVKMRWVPVPNAFDGDSYTVFVDHKDGAAYLGAWLAIVQVASKCDTRGTLVRHNGKPHTSATLSRMTRLPEKLFDKVIDRLCSEDVGWLEIIGTHGDTEIPHVPATIPQEPAQKEGRKGIEKKEVYGELGKVKLTSSEYSKLLSKHGKVRISAAIEVLDTYIGSKGDKYKSHFAVFKDNSWIWERVPASEQQAPKTLSQEGEYNNALLAIINQYDFEEDKSRYWKACWDKYRDIPKIMGVHVVNAAMEQIKKEQG